MAFKTGNYSLLSKNTPLTLSTYTPASDWISITGAVTDQVIFLVSDAINGQYTIRTQFTRPGSENIYINWGDGTTDTISTTTATNTSHTYTSGGTACTRGYNTWKITISGDSGTRITESRFVQLSTEFSEYPCGLLQAWYGNNTVTTMQSYFNEANSTPLVPFFTYLEYVRCPEGMTSSTALAQTFQQACKQLQKVDLPTSLSFLSSNGFELTFYECNALVEISDIPSDMTGITSLDQTFFNCYSLQKINFLGSSLPLVTTLNRAFQNNSALGYLNLPSLPECTNWTLTFTGCRSIRFINVPTLKNGVTHTFSSTFNNCSKLQGVNIDPNFTGTMVADAMFNGCQSLPIVNLPNNCNITTYSSTFSGCRNLKQVSIPMNASGTTTFATMFNECNLLQSFTFPTTPPSTSVPLNSMFTNCFNIDSITIPTGYTLTTLQSTFQGCVQLTNIVLPNNTQNGITTMQNMCNGCSALQTITMPTSMTSNGNLTGTFQNCYALKSVVFPTTMNSVTSAGNLFNSCYSLQTVTLPTSMSFLGASSTLTYTNMFADCRSIQEIVMPSTVSSSPVALISTQGMFNNCYSLKRVVLPPVTWTNTIQTATNTFSNCFTLTGITNLEYYGASGTTSTNYANGTTWGTGSRNILTLDFYCKFSKLELQGTGTGTDLSKLSTLRLRNGGSGQYGGTSPQINISFTNLSQAALVQVFNDLPTVTAKTINITSATGAAALTAGERAIATGKGWTIVG